MDVIYLDSVPWVDLADVLMVLGTQCVFLTGQNAVLLQVIKVVTLVWEIIEDLMVDPLLVTAIDMFLVLLVPLS
jgi:hypothetical protein